MGKAPSQKLGFRKNVKVKASRAASFSVSSLHKRSTQTLHTPPTCSRVIFPARKERPLHGARKANPKLKKENPGSGA